MKKVYVGVVLVGLMYEELVLVQPATLVMVMVMVMMM